MDDIESTFQSRENTPTRDNGVPLPLAERKRHKNVWFEDGNVILATPKVLFRVFRGILALHSPVFRDMFLIPQPITASDEDTLDGIPVVQIHDDDRQLAHFLRALHDQSYYCYKNPTDYDTIEALLRLSSKYQVQHLRQQTIDQLSADYPVSLNDFDLSHVNVWSVRHLVENAPTNEDLIELANKECVMQILPSAYYRFVFDFVAMGHYPAFWDYNDLNLSKDDIRRAFVGREELRNALRDEIGKFLYEPSPEGCESEDCIRLKDQFLRSSTWRRWDQFPDIFNPRLVSEMVRPPTGVVGLCKKCKTAYGLSIKNGRQNAWKNLPTYFGYPNWNELVRVTKDGFISEPVDAVPNADIHELFAAMGEPFDAQEESDEGG